MSLVTVVITTYNHACFLDESIRSALAQEGAPIEVLVVDDGSRDDPASVAAGYPSVRMVSQANQGLSAARNRGMREAAGRFLQFLDADDRLLPDAIACNLALFEEHPACALVHGSYRSVDHAWRPIWQPPPFRLGEDPLTDLLVRGNRIGMHATVMYRRDRLMEAGGFDTSLPANEDYDLYLRLAGRYPMASSPRVIAEYRHHDGNMSGDAALMLTSALRVLEKQRPGTRSNGALARALGEGERHMRAYWIRAQLRQARTAWAERRRLGRAVAATARVASLAPLAFAGEVCKLTREAIGGERPV